MTDQDQSREAFERHVLAPTGIYENGAGWIIRNSDGSYRHANIQERWTTWQAALNHKAADATPTSEVSSGVATECCGGYCGGKGCS